MYQDEELKHDKVHEELMQAIGGAGYTLNPLATDGVEAGGRRRRGSSPEPEKEVEENPVVLLCQQHAEWMGSGKLVWWRVRRAVGVPNCQLRFRLLPH
jgi:hypothetical protein